MRILILNQYALPAGEAGITRHGDIGAELVRRGHEVTVIASDFDYFSRQRTRRGGETNATTHDGVKFVWLRTGAYVGNDRRRMSSMVRYAMSATWAGIRQRPAPDVIIGSSPQPLAPLAADGVARLRRVPWIFEARDIWPSALVDLKAIKRGGRTHRLLERLERYSYQRANAVVSVPPLGSLPPRGARPRRDQGHAHPEWSNDAPERAGSDSRDTRSADSGRRRPIRPRLCRSHRSHARLRDRRGGRPIPEGDACRRLRTVDRADRGRWRCGSLDATGGRGAWPRSLARSPGHWQTRGPLAPAQSRCMPHAGSSLRSLQIRLQPQQALRLLRCCQACPDLVGPPDAGRRGQGGDPVRAR